MNMNELTQKSIEAIQAAQELAVANSHQTLQPEHLCLALLDQPQGLIPQLLERMQLNLGAVQAAVQDLLRQLPGVSGPGREADKIYISQELDQILRSSHMGAGATDDDMEFIETLTLRLRDKYTKKMMRYSTHAPVTLVAYVSQMEVELSNIINIVEAIRYQLAPADIAKMLIL